MLRNIVWSVARSRNLYDIQNKNCLSPCLRNHSKKCAYFRPCFVFYLFIYYLLFVYSTMLPVVRINVSTWKYFLEYSDVLYSSKCRPRNKCFWNTCPVYFSSIIGRNEAVGWVSSNLNRPYIVFGALNIII